MEEEEGETDPVRLLLKFYIEERMDEVSTKETDVVIGDRSWPKDTRTRFRKIESTDADTEQFHSLFAILHYLKISLLFPMADRFIIFNSHRPNFKLNLFKILPDELVVKIFSYFPSSVLTREVSLVNRRFRRASMTPSLWTELTLPKFTKRFDLIYAERLLDRFSMLRTLDLNSRPESVALTIKALTCHQGMKSLLNVKWSQNVELQKDFISAIGNATSLRKLRLERLYNCQSLTDNAKVLRNLTEISLSSWKECKGLIRAIGDNCKRLECFISDRTDKDFNYFLKSVKDTLTSLELCSVKRTDEALCDIDQCVHLESLKLSTCDLTDIGLESIFRLPRLHTLHIGRVDGHYISRAVSRVGMPKLLTELGISVLTNDGLMTVADHCPDIKVVNLYDCTNIDDSGIKHLLCVCARLTELRVGHDAHKVTEAAFDGAIAPITVLTLRKSCPAAGQTESIRLKLPLLKELIVE